MSTSPSRTLYVSRERVEQRGKDRLKLLLTKGEEADKLDALWQIVKETGMGMNHQDLLLTLTTVIPTTRDKRLILLFYLYMEGVAIEDEQGSLKDEILMVCNLIRSHLAHPNEHIRTKAVRLVGRFRNAAIFDALKAPFAENLSYSNPYVRAAAFVALRPLMAAEETRGIFEDVFGLLKEQLLVERDSVCLCEGYKTVEGVDLGSALVLYHQMADTTHSKLKECFLRTAEKIQDLERVYQMSQPGEEKEVALEASILLVRLGKTPEVVRQGAERLLELSSDYLDASSKRRIVQECRAAYRRGGSAFEGLGLKFGRLVTPAVAKVNPSLAHEIFRFVMEILVIVEAKEWFAYLLQQFADAPVKEGQKPRAGYEDKVFWVGALTEVLRVYKLAKPALTATIVGMLQSPVPELALEAAKYVETLLALETELRAPILAEIAAGFGEIRYGKILRKVFELVKTFADSAAAKDALEKLFAAVGSQQAGVLGQLEAKDKDAAKVFPGVGIAEFLLSLSAHAAGLPTNDQQSFRVTSTSVALKLCAIGEQTGALDMASKIALLKVAEFLASSSCLAQSPARPQPTATTGYGPNLLKGSLDTKPHFSLIKEPGTSQPTSRLERFISQKSSSSLAKLQNVFQLTSQMDPLYCECQITCNRTEIILDALIVNQTEMHLEDIEFDLVASANIKVVRVPQIESIRPHTAQTFTATLLMEEADAGFIGGIVTAGRIGRDNFFLQHLQEIRFNLADMLKLKAIGATEFREKWGLLLWENFYTITITNTQASLNEIAALIVKETKGTVIDSRTREGSGELLANGSAPAILVQNILTTTSQGTDMFINAMLQQSSNSTVASFRIRGDQCRVVKSLCQLISRKLKGMV